MVQYLPNSASSALKEMLGFRPVQNYTPNLCELLNVGSNVEVWKQSSNAQLSSQHGPCGDLQGNSRHVSNVERHALGPWYQKHAMGLS